MAIHIVRLGSPRTPDEGLRLGTVRRPPRGVPKAEFASRDFYDVWQPLLFGIARTPDSPRRQPRVDPTNTQIPCGSEPARESGVSDTIMVD
jgi:hypothetical protein